MRRHIRITTRSAALALMLCIVWGASADQVTFQVNMGTQVDAGRFDPAADTVEVHGSFDGWASGVTLAASGASPNVYSGTVDVAGAAGSAVQYKFVINQAGALVWEDNGVGPNGAQNRQLSLD